MKLKNILNFLSGLKCFENLFINSYCYGVEIKQHTQKMNKQATPA